MNLAELGTFQLHNMVISVVDPVTAYVDLMSKLFDFDAIKDLIAGDFKFAFDAMHAVTGPYAKAIFVDRLDAAPSSLMNATPLPDFGGGHPDPNPVYAAELFKVMFAKDAPDFGAASDGDGDRNIVLGKNRAISPSDSLAIITANAHHIPAFAEGLTGVARSMPTSRAVVRVAERLGIEHFETPTGWKFFGNLLDAGRITLCGEESAGTGANHVREKDGLWAILCWLNIIAARKMSVDEIVRDHWATYGRNFYSRHDYEGVDPSKADAVMDRLLGSLDTLPGQSFGLETVSAAKEFEYSDPVDGSFTQKQGIIIEFESGARLIFRKSGTGTVGATLRVYLEKPEQEPDNFEIDTQIYLRDLIEIARELSDIQHTTGREEPSVIS